MSQSANTNAYLVDLIDFVKQDAYQTRSLCTSAVGEKRTFLEGKLLAYNEVISSMRNQAIAFGMNLSEFHLHDIEPDKDLLP